MSNQIGSLNEKPLHAALKAWYAEPGDQLEVAVHGYVIDIVRGDVLIEIQTGSFGSIKNKLLDLVARQRVRLVYPVAKEKWIIKLAEDGEAHLSRRRSPKRGSLAHVFRELVSFPDLIPRENFALEVLLIQEEEIRRFDGTRAWRRRGWVTHERRLLNVVDRRSFQTPESMASLLPACLPDPFTTSDLATCLAQPKRLAQQMAYCLRRMGIIAQVGKRGKSNLYTQLL